MQNAFCYYVLYQPSGKLLPPLTELFQFQDSGGIGVIKLNTMLCCARIIVKGVLFAFGTGLIVDVTRSLGWFLFA